MVLAKDIFREHEILVRLERTVLFVNWVSCGTSALSLRIASLDRLSYFMLSYRHRCSKFADLVRLCEYLSTFFKCKNNRFLKKSIMIMLENLHTRTKLAGCHGHCLQIPNTGDCAPNIFCCFYSSCFAITMFW